MKRTLLLTAAVPLLLLVGGGGAVASAAPDPAPMTDPSGDPEDRIREFIECMREHGVDLPDLDEGEPVHIEIRPGESAEADAALRACEEHLPKPPRPAELDPAQRAEIEEFEQCLREHGLDVPRAGQIGLTVHPDAGAGGEGPLRRADGPGTPPPDGPRPLPGAEEAFAACADLMPVPVGGGLVVGSADGAAGTVSVGVGEVAVSSGGGDVIVGGGA
jgi:hypothetical protein